MVGPGATVLAVVLLLAGCGGGEQQAPEEAPQVQQPPAGQPPAPAEKAAEEDYDDYEELDVWIEADPDEGPPPLKVHFTSEVESDEEGGGPYNYKWDFGDGSSSTEANPIHTYEKLGEYTVTCSVTDAKGSNGSDEIDVWVEEE
jgi:uncharacterized membrane protein